MKFAKCCKSLVLISVVVFANTAFAVTPGDDERKECKKPKFREFLPAPQVEVPPESEVSFHISRDADPLHITAEAKGEKLPLEIKHRVTRIEVKTKLPASIQEGFVRIHVTAKAAEGECIGQDGWLIKIKAADAPATTVVEPEKK
jgi:hypothetical protein